MESNSYSDEQAYDEIQKLSLQAIQELDSIESYQDESLQQYKELLDQLDEMTNKIKDLETHFKGCDREIRSIQSWRGQLLNLFSDMFQSNPKSKEQQKKSQGNQATSNMNQSMPQSTESQSNVSKIENSDFKPYQKPGQKTEAEQQALEQEKLNEEIFKYSNVILNKSQTTNEIASNDLQKQTETLEKEMKQKIEQLQQLKIETEKILQDLEGKKNQQSQCQIF